MTVTGPEAAAGGGSYKTGRWSENEKNLFLRALSIFGHGPFRWKRISEYVGTRTPVQCKTHHQKLVNKAEREYARRREAAEEEGLPKEDCVLEFRMVLETAKRYKSKRGLTDSAVAAAREEVSAATACPLPENSGITFQDEVKECPGILDVTNPTQGRWTDHEKRLYSEAMAIYGKGRWKLVAKYVGTRTSTQCKTHHQKVIEKHSKTKDLSINDEERFADAEGDETPGREEAVVARALCNYRHGNVGT